MSNQQSVKPAAEQSTSFLCSPFAHEFPCPQMWALVVVLLTDWTSLAIVGKLAVVSSASSSCYFRREESYPPCAPLGPWRMSVAFGIRGSGCEMQVMHLIKFEIWFQGFWDFRPDSPPVVPHFLLSCNIRLRRLCSLKLFNILCSRKQTTE